MAGTGGKTAGHTALVVSLSLSKQKDKTTYLLTS
jgi:hypothetical protein